MNHFAFLHVSCMLIMSLRIYVLKYIHIRASLISLKIINKNYKNSFTSLKNDNDI